MNVEDKVPVLVVFAVCPRRHSNQMISSDKSKNSIKILKEFILLRVRSWEENYLISGSQDSHFHWDLK